MRQAPSSRYGLVNGLAFAFSYRERKYLPLRAGTMTDLVVVRWTEWVLLGLRVMFGGVLRGWLVRRGRGCGSCCSVF